jgi:S-adenosylmethionine synthetase
MGVSSIANQEGNYFFTSESVAEGHPDKICDQLSDAIVDLFLSKDPEARVACETFCTTNRVVIGGETRCAVAIDEGEVEQLARSVIRDIGYEQEGFNWRNAKVEVLLHGQSGDIAVGVDAAAKKEEGAGDQGMMFGFACSETDSLMPAPIHFAHLILANIARDRKAGNLPQLGPDAKSQVTLRYERGKPVGAESVVVSSQHQEYVSSDDVRELVRPYVMATLPDGWMCEEGKFYVNPTGRFVTGGPDGDTGLTGRKIIVDTYGGAARHGGGAFSGKDPTKVDRSAAYAARYLAKNVVAASLAAKCEIQLAYAIGLSQPLAIYVDTSGTGQIPDAMLAEALSRIMDLSPHGIRTKLGLNKPIYRRTATYGHFGRTPDADGGFSWEKLDLQDQLKLVTG